MASNLGKLRLLFLALFLASSILTVSYFFVTEHRRRFSFASTVKGLHSDSRQRLDSNRTAIKTQKSLDIVEPRRATRTEKIFTKLSSQGRRSEVPQPNEPKQSDGLVKIAGIQNRSTRQNIDVAPNANHTSRNNRKESRKNEIQPATTKTSMEQLVLRPTTSVYGESSCLKNGWRSGLKELFRAWIEMSQKHSLEHVLAFGSLLGAIRNGDVIPWDSDVDVLVDKKLFPVLEKLSAERNFDSADGVIRLVVQPEFTRDISESRKRFTCAGKETPNMVDQCSFQEPLGRLIKGNLHIDIFHFYHAPNHRIKEPSEGITKTYEKSDFFPLRPCRFLGMNSFCPNKPLKVLQLYFGKDDLEPPYKCKNGLWLNAKGRSP